MTAQDEAVPGYNPVGTTYAHAYTLGSLVPTGWTNFSSLGSMDVTQGTGNNERTGQWAYLKKSHMTISIDMKPNTESAEVIPGLSGPIS